MRGFISLGTRSLIPTFYTEDYYNLPALGRVVCSALDTVIPLCSSSDFKWQDWYGGATNWLPENPTSFSKLKEHLQTDECFRHEPFIMYIIPNEPAPPWQMVVYHDYDEEKDDMSADCRLGFEETPPQQIIIRLQELGFIEHIEKS